MTNHSVGSFILAMFGLAASNSSAVSGATYKAIFYMQQYSQPGPLAEGSPGVFYSYVVPPEVIISVTSQGTMTTLASFQSPPYNIESDPVTAANGLVYSSVEQTINGGSGNVFSVGSTAGSEHTYPTQTVAAGPITANLPDGKLFGLAYTFSNASYNLATVDLGGNVTLFYGFPGTDRPGLPLYGAGGNYYGTSSPAVSGAKTYFYRVTPSGAFTNIATLPYTGTGVLLEATDGNFYGVQPTSLGCSSSDQHGAVFKLTPSGQFTILHDFGVCGNAVVNSLIEGSDGKLYGATQANNVLFSLTKSGSYKVEFETGNPNTEGLCPCSLLQGSDGIIYGSASGGGPTGSGVIFALDAGLPVPKPRALYFSPKSGAAKTLVRIWGHNLFEATVEFNGVPAAKAVNSGPNYVWVRVPASATTGPITVTTPGGTSTTRESFTVN